MSDPREVVGSVCQVCEMGELVLGHRAVFESTFGLHDSQYRHRIGASALNGRRTRVFVPALKRLSRRLRLSDQNCEARPLALAACFKTGPVHNIAATLVLET